MHRLNNHNFGCNVCDTKCVSLEVLSEHKKKHIKIYKCNHCLYKANSEAELKNHITRRHSKEYECEWCDFASHTKAEVSEHETKEHKIKKTRKIFSCEKCDSIFRTTTALDSHMEEYHSTKSSNPGFKHLFTDEERRQNGFCRFWNHSVCKFENCKFLHEEAPHCRFQERCRAKPMCQYFHSEYASSGNQSSSFLGYQPFQQRWGRC